MEIRNIITNNIMTVDDSLGVDLIKKHPYDFEILKASENIKKTIEVAKVPSDEAKLLGLEVHINDNDIQENNIEENKLNIMTMSDDELIQFCKDKNIYHESETIENMRNEALKLLENQNNG